MRWFGIGDKTKDYFDSTLQLENAAAVSALDDTTFGIFISVVRWFFKSTPVFLIFSLACIYADMLVPLFYPRAWGPFSGKDTSGVIFFTFIGLVFFFAVPTLYGKLFLRENPRDFALKAPANKKKAIVLAFIALLLLEPYIFYFTKQSNFRIYYTAENVDWVQLALLNLMVFPVHYFAEEFFFRGFLFIGLWRRVKWHSFWMTDILFTFSHMGKPGLEILLCIPASVILNVLTLNTKSIYPAIFVHTTLGISMCLMVNWH